ncbi:MAG: hypothetical protein ACI92E_003105, partial [Oceanicoccus sp.]
FWLSCADLILFFAALRLAWICRFLSNYIGERCTEENKVGK